MVAKGSNPQGYCRKVRTNVARDLTPETSLTGFVKYQFHHNDCKDSDSNVLGCMTMNVIYIQIFYFINLINDSNSI